MTAVPASRVCRGGAGPPPPPGGGGAKVSGSTMVAPAAARPPTRPSSSPPLQRRSPLIGCCSALRTVRQDRAGWTGWMLRSGGSAPPGPDTKGKEKLSTQNLLATIFIIVIIMCFSFCGIRFMSVNPTFFEPQPLNPTTRGSLIIKAQFMMRIITFKS